MKEKNKLAERDREATEKQLVATIGQMVAEQGFEKIGINAVATQSGGVALSEKIVSHLDRTVAQQSNTAKVVPLGTINQQ